MGLGFMGLCCYFINQCVSVCAPGSGLSPEYLAALVLSYVWVFGAGLAVVAL